MNKRLDDPRDPCSIDEISIVQRRLVLFVFTRNRTISEHIYRGLCSYFSGLSLVGEYLKAYLVLSNETTSQSGIEYKSTNQSLSIQNKDELSNL
ncbi:MAG: hypothetical protein R2685_02655 [Candidatus Nitrosocosmicus sp.]|nr:hypothetical protein [Candidatus Nitrosocosmicus sp.]